MSKLGDVLSKLVQIKRITNGGLGVQPPAAGDYECLGAKPSTTRQFFVIFWKKSYFNAIMDDISHVLKAIT